MVVPQLLGLSIFLTSEPLLDRVIEGTPAQHESVSREGQRERPLRQRFPDDPAIPTELLSRLDNPFRRRRVRMRENNERPLTRRDPRRPELRRRMEMGLR